MFQPGQVWSDTEGNPIQAHGGGMLYDQGRYYWFGENKAGPTITNHPSGWERVDVIGISCYSSSDLQQWRNEGIVLSAVSSDPTHELHPERVLERPKVIYNARTQTYIMWVHIDTPDYAYARAGVAISDRPTGPYRYLGSMRPCDTDSRDLTVFQDDDGTAYLVFASEWNRNITIAQLDDEYLAPSPAFTKHFSYPYPSQGREAPALFKHDGTYYLITSGCTGWQANAAEYASAPSPLGPWTVLGNPCFGEGAERTFGAQGTYVFPLPTHPGGYIFMADCWNPTHLSDSSYLWLPISVQAGRVTIAWHDAWDLASFEQSLRLRSPVSVPDGVE